VSVLLSIDAFDEAVIRDRDFGGLLRPIMGGPDQRLNRLGDRFAVDYTLGDVESDSALGRALRAQLLQGKRQGALALFPQDGFDLGTIGTTPRVNGGGQLGTSLTVDGFPAGFVVPQGLFFSLITGGRRYVYCTASATTMNGSGAGSLTLTCMIRVAPADNSLVEVSTPYVEGFITSDVSFVYRPGNWQGQVVSIEEAE
jgi:hypothetical protein